MANEREEIDDNFEYHRQEQEAIQGLFSELLKWLLASVFFLNSSALFVFFQALPASESALYKGAVWYLLGLSFVVASGFFRGPIWSSANSITINLSKSMSEPMAKA